MDSADTQRLERAKKWLNEREHLTIYSEGVAQLLVEFENFLLACEAERMRQG